MRRFLVVLVSLPLLLVVSAQPALASDADEGCGFGQEHSSLWSLDGNTEIDPTEACRRTTWSLEQSKNVFGTSLSIEMYPDLDHPSSDSVDSIQI